ncbi:hypothetical protein PGTUg99_014515 [Puccinia graminis f. sp. tritici]|nr:hypothetical protein PGTUg99_014515 [Puccinia graminis f. sp. tritici]
MSKKGQPYVGCRGRLLSQIKGSAKETVSKLSVRFTTGGGWRNSSAYTAGPVGCPRVGFRCPSVARPTGKHPHGRAVQTCLLGGVEMNSQISPPSTAQANKSSPMRAPRAAAQGLCPAVRTQRIATHCD